MFDLRATERTSELRLHRFGRTSFLLLIALLVYLGSLGVATFNRTVVIEQDAAYYCGIAERHAAGLGYDSMADRRGPAPARAWPQPVEANTAWPWILGVATQLTGDAHRTGTFLNLCALTLLAALWPIGLWRILRLPGWVAVLCTVPLVLHREAFGAGTLPLTDGVSLLCNGVFIGLLMAGRTPWALPVLAAAIACRYQNVALMLPMAWSVIPASSSAVRFRWLLVPGALLAAMVYGWTQPGVSLGTGLWTAIDPSDRDSIWRGIRFLSIPVVIGAPVWIRSERLRPLLLLGLGHLLVLATHADPHDSRPWFFGQRQGLPLHLVASGLSMVVLARGRGGILWLSLTAALIAAGEHVRRPYKMFEARLETSGRPELLEAMGDVAVRRLPNDAIVLCHDADVLARDRGLRTVHTRAFRPGEAADATLANLRARGVTHALLLWGAAPVMAGRNAWMDRFDALLSAHGETLAREVRETPQGGKSGYALLRLRP